MELAVANLNKPSNKKWKKVADYFLYTLPLYSSAIAIGADQLWNAKVALVITVVINVVVVTLKGLTKFTSEPEPIVEPVVEEPKE
jgi:hypothetical protein